MPNFTGVMARPRLRVRMRGVEVRRSLARRASKPLVSFSCRQMMLDAAGVFHRLAVVRGVAFAIEVALAHHFRRQAKRARDAVENLFDHQHALRSAESAKGGLRRLVRAADAAGQRRPPADSRRCRSGTARATGPARKDRGSSRRRNRARRRSACEPARRRRSPPRSAPGTDGACR